MSMKKKNQPPDRVYDKTPCELHKNDDDGDDLMISQAYDLFLTQTTNQQERIQQPEKDDDDGDDLMISQAYDLLLTQATNQQERIQQPEKDRIEANEAFENTKNIPKVYENKRKEPIKDNSTAENNDLDTQENSIDYLNDLVALDDLREAISPSFFPASYNLPLLPDITEDEDEWIDVENGDLTEATTIANITVMNIFHRCWQSIANKQESLDLANNIVMEILNRAWKLIKPRSRWRQSDSNSWKRNIAKKRRADGLPYVTAKKIRQAKIPKAANCSVCKYRCTEKISPGDRDLLCRKYWSLDYTAKKNFILNLIQVKPVKTTVLIRKRATQRSNSKEYFFKIDNLKLQVCQSFFCKTLCVSPSVVTDAVANSDDMGSFCKDRDPRGRQEPTNKTSAHQLQEVNEHINSFPTMESHYVRKKLKRKYLDASLSINKMYKLYVEQCQEKGNLPVSEATYRKIFGTDFNLGFFAPKKDQCLLCTKYNRLNEEEKADPIHSSLKQEYLAHIERKEACNKEKEKDKKRAEKEENFLSASFDLQAILQIPSGDVGLLYYCRKLTVYNLTIYESAAPNDAYCFAWNETNGKKGSSEIGSILLYYLSEIPERYHEVSLFSDTCGGQNRNQYIAAVLLWAVHKIKHINIIEHKFLESGHSYMEVDSMHSCIESAKKHTNVYSMTEWLNIFRRARTSRKAEKQSKKPYHVKEMKYTDFKDLKMLSTTILKNKCKMNTEGQQVKWLKIKRMKYVKGDSRIYYNYDMTENFFSIDFDVQPQPETQNEGSMRKNRYNTRKSKMAHKDADIPQPYTQQSTGTYFPIKLQQLYTESLPISAAKKKDLVQLCEKGVIPEEYHGWFANLKSDRNSTDHVPDLTISDESDELSDE